MTTARAMLDLIPLGFAAFGFLLLPLAMTASGATCAPDVVLVNGRVHTVDPSRPEAEAVAICGERIAQVGTTTEIRALVTGRTRVIDLAGRRVVPGFNDAHVHFIDGAEELVGVNLRPATDERDLARRLAERASKLPAGRWILVGNWDHEAWPSKALPTHRTIDEATPNNPVFVQRLDGHMALANSVAMKLAGITRDTPSPDGGTIVRDEAGEPTGIFKDNAMALVSRVIPPPSLDEVLEKARAGLRHAAELGITTIQDMTASATELAAYQALRERGELTARIYSIQNHGIDGLVRAGIRTGFGDDWIRIGGVKLFADGSMGSGTAAFFDSYTDDPATKGLLMQSPEELRKAMIDADAAGFQLIVHAIGDRANAIVVDAMEQVARVNGARDRRPRIEHAQVVREADKQRMGRLGIIASIQPSHCIDDMRWAERRIGRDRCALAYDFKSFVDAGVKVAFGTDWFVEPLDPMLGLYAAVTRQFPDGTPAGGWFREEKITMAQAVEFYTRGSAYAQYAEADKGSIAPGNLADLVVLSRDIFTIPPREILETKPVLTMVGGRIVFAAQAFQSQTSQRSR
ncbi:MAG TPA: amidohydrolase [Gemmatimonadaceae bacterium]